MAGGRHHPGEGLDDVVEGAVTALRSGLAEAGNRAVDDVRIHRPEVVVAETEPLHCAGAEVLHDHVGVPRQGLEDLPALRGLQIQRHGPLVGGLGLEVGAHAGVAQRVDGPHPAVHVRVSHRLDLDDVGPQHRELIGRKRTGENVRHVEDADSFEWLHVGIPGPGW